MGGAASTSIQAPSGNIILHGLCGSTTGGMGSYDRTVGRMLIILGVILIVAGLLVTLGERLPVRLGRLPGDIVIRGKNSVFYFPLVTSLLLSLLLTGIMWLIGRR